MQTCGALAQLLGCCPGSIVAVLVTLMGGMLAAAASGHEGVLGPAVPSSAGWVKLVAEASVGSRGQAVVWPWGWPRQGLKGKGPSILAQSRGLGTTCLWPHRSLGGLGGNCITVATGDPEGCPGGRGAGRPDLEPPGPQSQACSYGPLRGLLLGIWDGLAR